MADNKLKFLQKTFILSILFSTFSSSWVVEIEEKRRKNTAAEINKNGNTRKPLDNVDPPLNSWWF